MKPTVEIFNQKTHLTNLKAFGKPFEPPINQRPRTNQSDLGGVALESDHPPMGFSGLNDADCHWSVRISTTLEISIARSESVPRFSLMTPSIRVRVSCDDDCDDDGSDDDNDDLMVMMMPIVLTVVSECYGTKIELTN